MQHVSRGQEFDIQTILTAQILQLARRRDSRLTGKARFRLPTDHFGKTKVVWKQLFITTTWPTCLS